MAKFQQIKYTKKGVAFVTYYGARLKLEKFIKTNSILGKSGDESIIINRKEVKAHAWYSSSYYGAYGIHISDCREYAKVFYKSNF